MGSVPTLFKAAYITPLLKKPDLDSADPKSYRPIANLSVLSTLLERLVVRQLLDYLNAARLLPELQSVDIQETAEDGTVCSELSIAPAASDTLLSTARAVRTSFRFCFVLFRKVS